MQRRSITGLVFAIVFTLANLAGGIYAAAMGEMRHATMHAALTLLGGWIVLQLAAARRQPALPGPSPSLRAVAAGAFGDRLTSLEQSLDAIAVEVERVGEGQRYMTDLVAKTREGEPDKR